MFLTTTANPAPKRRGATLLEVLIGFLILSVGAVSVFTLFPFAALTVSFAMKDDRTTTCAITADAIIRDTHRQVVEAGDTGTTEPYHHLMDNPGDFARSPTGAASGLPPLTKLDSGPSYPVYVDPMGNVAGRGAVGDFGAARVPRVTLGIVLNQPATVQQAFSQRLCSQMDGLSFDENGVVQPGVDMREMRYNFAWMLQRPSNRDRFTVRQQVIVYDRRAHLYAPSGSEVVSGRGAVTLTPGETTITGVPLNFELRKGSWVLDAGDPEGGVLRHAEFYRVVSINEVAGSYTIEVHKPVTRPDGLPNGYNARLVFISAIADVFERPLLTASN